MSKKDVPAYITENDVFPTRLREIMTLRGTNQTRLAAQIKDDFDFTIQRQSISKYMNGQTKPDVDTITIICKALDVSADYLLGISNSNTLDISARGASEYTGLSAASVMQLHLLKDSNEIKFIRRFLDEFVSFTDATNLQNRIFTAALALYNSRNSHHGMQLATANLNNIITSQPDGTYSIPPLDAADYYRSTAVQITSHKIDTIISEMVEQLCDEIEYSMESVGSYNINDTILTPNNSEFDDLPF